MTEIPTDLSSPFFGGHRYLKSTAVMTLLGYTSRASFWEFVRRSGVPHIRLNARRIMFEEKALLAWLAQRSS
jgi:predicted DNA-binding transcriptional regulator AlpA